MVAVCGERFKWGGEVPVKKWIVGLLRQKKTCFERYLGNGRQTILVVYFGNSLWVKVGRAFMIFFASSIGPKKAQAPNSPIYLPK
jgi:hypothetical protein